MRNPRSRTAGCTRTVCFPRKPTPSLKPYVALTRHCRRARRHACGIVSVQPNVADLSNYTCDVTSAMGQHPRPQIIILPAEPHPAIVNQDEAVSMSGSAPAADLVSPPTTHHSSGFAAPEDGPLRLPAAVFAIVGACVFGASKTTVCVFARVCESPHRKRRVLASFVVSPAVQLLPRQRAVLSPALQRGCW